MLFVEAFDNKRYYRNEAEDFIVEVFTIDHDPNEKCDLMCQWVKEGRVEKYLPTTLHVKTYYTDSEGNCTGRYNIQRASQEQGSGCRSVINFDYLLEDTPENEWSLVRECERLMLADSRTKREKL